jgi:hypothetical protein
VTSLLTPTSQRRPTPALSARRRALRPQRPSGYVPTAMSVLIVLTWGVAVLPRLLQSLTSDKYRTTVDDGITYSHYALLLNRLLTESLLAFALLAVVLRVRRLPSDGRRALVIFLAPWLYLVLRDLYSHVHPHTEAMLYPLVVLAVWALQPRFSQLRLLGYLSAATTFVSIAMGAALPKDGIYRAVTGSIIAPNKKILPIGLLVGPFTDSNNLGQVLVIGLPALLLIPQRGLRVVSILATSFAIVWTSSRSSIGGMVAAGFVVLLLGVLPARARRSVVWFVLVALGALVVALPVLTTKGTAFTNRGFIWTTSLHAVYQNAFFGLGSNWYDNLAKYSNGLGGLAFHGHNQFVQTMVFGGLIAFFLVLLMMRMLVKSASEWADRGEIFPAALMAAFFVSCCLEVSFGFNERDFLLAVTALPMAFLVFARPDQPAAITPTSGTSAAARTAM